MTDINSRSRTWAPWRGSRSWLGDVDADSHEPLYHRQQRRAVVVAFRRCFGYDEIRSTLSYPSRAPESPPAGSDLTMYGTEIKKVVLPASWVDTQ